MSNLDRKLDYYKWFWQDWRADRKVQRMTYVERGLYRELLDECWAEGGIPNDVEMLADICGCPSDVMASAWQVLSKCFVDSGNCLANGKQILTNEKLESVRTAKDAERVKKSLSGKKGGLAKALNQKPFLANPSNCQASPSNRHIEEKRREENNTLSGKPDVADYLTSQAIEVLEHLNQKTGANFRPVDSNLKLIKSRIKEFCFDDCISVIDKKCVAWSNSEFEKYLRPSTLFNASKFAAYAGEPIPKQSANQNLTKLQLIERQMGI